jgi:uncharacterized protein (DUF1697 family)
MSKERSVAFLRAINVGGRVVKMDRLRAIFEAAGFRNVETLIASGNVIFDTRAVNKESLETKIERALEKALGYEVATFVRSAAEVDAVARREPFGERAEQDTLFVGFLKEQPAAPSGRKIADLSTATDRFLVHGREVYWLRKKGSETIFSAALLEKALGLAMTMRNVTTVRKLAEKYANADDSRPRP